MMEEDLDAVAAMLAEIVEQEGVLVDEQLLASHLRDLDRATVAHLCAAIDPGGLLDTIEAIAPEVFVWDAG